MDQVLKGDYAAVLPAEAVFRRVEPGLKYVLQVSVRNTSSRGRRVRMIAPRSPAFELLTRKEAELAPGLEHIAELSYCCDHPVNLEDSLRIDIGRPDGEMESLTVPVRVFEPCAVIRLDSACDFGEVVQNAHTIVTKYVTVENTGARDGTLIVEPPMHEAFALGPSECRVAAGGSARLKVEFSAAQLGPVKEALKLQVVGGELEGEAQTLTVAVNVVRQLLELRDAQGKQIEQFNLGRVFKGMSRSETVYLINTGPQTIDFSLSDLNDQDPDDPSAAALSCVPLSGMLPPRARTELVLTFAPRKGAKLDEKGFLTPDPAEEEVAEDPEQEAIEVMMSMLQLESNETGQKIDFRLSGEAVCPRLRLSSTALDFGECAQYEYRDRKLILHNGNAEPFNFSLGALTGWTATPSAGTVPPLSPLPILLRFCPKQLGAFKGSVELLGFGGKVLRQTVHLSGSCGTMGKATLVGGLDALPEDFERPLQLVDRQILASAGGLQPPPTWAREPAWSQSARLEQPMQTVLQSLRKRKTQHKQQELRRQLDHMDLHDTGFDLSAQEQESRAAHRKLYSSYLQAARAERERDAAQRQQGQTLDDFVFGAGLGLNPDSGLTPPYSILPREREPLWLQQPTGQGSDSPRGARKLAIFDPNNLVARKFKPKPVSAEEVRECKQPLSAKELMMVTGGPKVIDFGIISIYTQVARSFSVMNEMRTSCLVTVHAHEEEELEMSTPLSQVVPPGRSAGFDIVFCSHKTLSYRRTISYVINGLHAFKFTAVAEVVPLDIGLSEDALDFAFPLGSTAMSVSRSLTLTNTGTYPASFRWEHPLEFKGTPAFIASPEEAEIPPKKSLTVDVTFTPQLDANCEHALTAIVHGGSARTVVCSATLEEARCVIIEKKLQLGSLAVGVASEKTFTVKNPGAVEAVVSFEAPPPGWTITPSAAAIPAGSSVEVALEVLCSRAASININLVGLVRYGRPVKLPVQLEALVPKVSVLEDEFDFEQVVAGGTSNQPLTLRNESPVAAILYADFSAHQQFELRLASKQSEEEAKAMADTAEVATTVVDGDDDDSPLQLLPPSAMPASPASPGPAGANESELNDDTNEGGGGVFSERVYRIIVPPCHEGEPGKLALSLNFAPRADEEYAFELPLKLTGVEATPALRKAVVGEGLKARLQMSTTLLKFGECILRDASLPYEREITLDVAPEESEVGWALDVTAIPKESGYSLNPNSGVLRPGETATVRVKFTPTEVGVIAVPVPVLINVGGAVAPRRRSGERPYLQLMLHATATKPKLAFDRPEIVLSPVPLGATSRASFYVLNQGYDNLQVGYRLPADTERMPIELHFPEGNLVGLARKRLLLMISFSSRKAMSFTAQLELLDDDGNRFPINVTCTADNCLLTLQPYLHAAPPGQFSFTHEEGKAPMLVNNVEAARTAAILAAAAAAEPAGRKSHTPSVASRGAPSSVHTPATSVGREPKLPPLTKEQLLELAREFFAEAAPTEAELSALLQENQRTGAIVMSYISSSLMRLGASGGGDFPSQLTANKGKALCELVQMLSGKQLPLPAPPTDRKSARQELRYHVDTYEALLTFLRAHSALLGSLGPEYLLPPEAFLKLREEKMQAAGTLRRGGLSSRRRAKLLQEHGASHSRHWLQLLMQVLKVFVLSRITPRALKGMPGFPDEEHSLVTRDPALGTSNAFSASEELLVSWFAQHHRAATAVKVPEAPPPGKKPPRGPAAEKAAAAAAAEAAEAAAAAARVRPRPLSPDGLIGWLRDGHVFAAAIMAHCPYAQGKKPPSTQRGGGAAAGKSESADATLLEQLAPQPCNAHQCAENLQLVMGALEELGCPFGAEGCAPVSGHALMHVGHAELLLLAMFLYQTLPHYVPKALVQFVGGLHEPLSKTIELTNPARKPIVYQVRLEGAPCFRLPVSEVQLAPRAMLEFQLEASASFRGEHSGRVVFLSKGDGLGVANASTLVFELQALIGVGAPLQTTSVEARLYQALPVTLSVTNPFDEACTLAVSLSEVKPALDLFAGDAAGGADAKGGRRSKANAAAQAAAQAAAMTMLQELEDVSKKLPNSCFCASQLLTLEPKAEGTLTVQFLPFQLGEYVCTVLLSDEAVGEFSLQLRGNAVLPQPLDTLRFVAEVSTSGVKELLFPFRNPQLERARQLVLERSGREKERMQQIWGKQPLVQGHALLELSSSSPYFNVPAKLDLYELQRGGRASVRGSAAGTAAASVVQSSAVTPKPEKDAGGAKSLLDQSITTIAVPADANKLSVRFVPKEPGMYAGELLCFSPLDVRCYELAGTANAPGMKASLEFAAPARQTMVQELPIVNGMDAEWTVQASLRGAGFSGPAQIKVPAKATAYYPLEFIADWVGETTGDLALKNATTGDSYEFSLKGIGEDPLAEHHLTLECVARQPSKLRFTVFNISGNGKACVLSVDSDLVGVSGAPTVEVPVRSKGDAEEREYWLTVNPQMGGIMQGSLTFTAPDGRYMWYTVELRAQPPPAETRIQVSAPLRKVVAIEIPIEIPSGTAEELIFTVTIEGENLYGDDTVTVGADGKVYELFYSPLVAGESSGTISFVNELAGEFWYELALRAEATEPAQLPKLSCPVGGSTTHVFTISNPVGEECPLKLRNSNPANFSLSTASGMPFVLAPYADLELMLTYTPGSVDETERTELSLAHEALGEWLYRAEGVGLEPGLMKAVEVTASLGQPTSSTISFRNPFPQPLSLNVSLEHHSPYSEAAPPFKLLKKAQGVPVAANGSVSLPFAFTTDDMAETTATVTIATTHHGRKLAWRFPLAGVAVSRPLLRPVVLQCKARQPLQRELQLPIPGLEPGAGEEAFSYELDVAQEHSELLARTLRLTPLQRTLVGSTLSMEIDWQPLRPLRTSAALVVQKASGGRWRYDLLLEAGEPEPDDVITIEAALNRTAAVSFRLPNAFDADEPFAAYLTPDTPAVFAVSPVNGVLSRAGTPGTLFTVTYSPIEYGKVVRGMLVIVTDEMQWSYELHGSVPVYRIPEVERSLCDHTLQPELAEALETANRKGPRRLR